MCVNDDAVAFENFDFCFSQKKDDILSRIDSSHERVALETGKLAVLLSQLSERDAAVVKLRDELTATTQRTTTEIDALNSALVNVRRAEAATRAELAAERATVVQRDAELASARAELAPIHTEVQFLRGEVQKYHKSSRPDDGAQQHRGAQQYAVDIDHRAQKKAEHQKQVDEAAADHAIDALRHEPAPQAPAHLPNDRVQLAAPTLEARQLYAELDARQFASADTCAGKRAVIFSFDSFKRYGFATALHHISLALLYARDTGRVLVLRNPDEWIYSSPSCRHGFECYFASISSCTEESLQAERPRGSLHEGNENDAVVLYTSAGVTYDVVSKRGAQYRTLWWRANVMRWLLRPRDAFLLHIDAFRKEHRWADDTGVIGMHVRHGDKKVEVSQLYETQEYFDVALRLRAANPQLHTIFLSSDDANVIQQATAEGARTGFRVIHRRETRTNDAVHALLTQGRADPLEQGTVALENIWLLSLCDEMIGTFSSSFFKLAYELRHARTNATTAHSLDLVHWQA